MNTPGLRTIGEWVYEGSSNIDQNVQVLEKIFTLLKELNMKSDHFEIAHVFICCILLDILIILNSILGLALKKCRMLNRVTNMMKCLIYSINSII